VIVPCLLATLIAAATLLAFAPSLNAEFVDFDDRALLVENTRYRAIDAESLRWMFSTTFFGHYQPLTWLSYAIDFARTDLSPGRDANFEMARATHQTNLAIHALNALLVFALVRQLLTRRRDEPTKSTGVTSDGPTWIVAATSAMLWSVHPLRVESVAWATERRDVLSTCFLLGSTLAYLAANRRALGRARNIWLIGSIALLAISLLCKAWGMSLFVVLLILDVCPLKRLPIEPWHWLRREYRRVLLEKIPFAILGVTAAIMAGEAQKSAPGAVRSLAEWPVTSRIAQAAFGLVFYLRKSLVPTRLVALVELPREMNWLAPRYLACYGIVVVFALVAVVLRNRFPAIICAFAAYVVLLLPVLGTFQSGDQFVADRYSYVAMIPIMALLAWGAMVLLGRVSRNGVSAGVSRFALSARLVFTFAMIAVLIALSRAQTRVWHDAESLWAHAVTYGPPSSATQVNLGIAIEQSHRIEAATPHYLRATKINPNDGRAWFLAGKALRAQKRYEEAAGALRVAAEHMPQAYMAWVTLGNMLFHDLNRLDEGLVAYREGVRDLTSSKSGSAATRQLSGVPYLALGTALKKVGDLSGARQAFESATAYPDAIETARQQLQALPKP
jgi:hypothetical protein